MPVEIQAWTSESEVSAAPHAESMYGFKPMAFLKAFAMGYTSVLWLDASILVIKDLEPIFHIIEKDGYFFQDSGWMNKQWCNARAKDYFGTDAGEMLSSGVLGINLRSEIGLKFFAEWYVAMRSGIFNGSHDDHRHDQLCASIIAHKLGMKLQEGNTFFIYGKPGDPRIKENTLALADGICL